MTMSESPGAQVFSSEDVLSCILSHADRKSTVNVMVSCHHGLVVGCKIYWRESTEAMMAKLGSLMCPPSRLALYCNAVRRLQTTVRDPDGDRYAQLVGPFPHATELVGTASLYQRFISSSPDWESGDEEGGFIDEKSRFVVILTAIPCTESRVLKSVSSCVNITTAAGLKAGFQITEMSDDETYNLWRACRARLQSLESCLLATPRLLSGLKALSLGELGDIQVNEWIHLLKGVPLLDLRMSIPVLHSSILQQISSALPTLQFLHIGVNSHSSGQASFDSLLSPIALPALRGLEIQLHDDMLSSPLSCINPQQSRQPTLPLGKLEHLEVTVTAIPEGSLLQEAFCLSRYIPAECQVEAMPSAGNGPQMEMWSDLLAMERSALPYTRVSHRGWTQLGESPTVPSQSTGSDSA